MSALEDHICAGLGWQLTRRLLDWSAGKWPGGPQFRALITVGGVSCALGADAGNVEAGCLQPDLPMPPNFDYVMLWKVTFCRDEDPKL